MSFDKTNASKYVEAVSDKIIVSGVIGGSETAKELIDSGNVQFGVKGEANILKMDADVNIQSGDSCSGRNPLGDVKLSDAKIVVTPLKDTKNLCSRTLYNTHFAFEELNEKFAQFIMELRAKLIAGTNEKMLWQGDTDSTTIALNLRRIDGILKKLSGATAATGADLVLKLQSIVSASDVDLMSNDDFYLFMGRDTYNSYRIALANKNIYQATDDNMLFGTTVKIKVVSGLNGTGKVVASRLSNFQLGLDLQGDSDVAKLKYDENSENWFQDFYYALGIGVAYADEAKQYTV